jgi:hypothetical protein
MRRHLAVSVFFILALCCGIAGPARANVLITVDKDVQQMTVKVDGQLRWTWPVSTGIARYDTPNGEYTAFRMEAEHFSKEWDDAPMPHSIFFTRQGHAIHGSFHSKLGRPASHGCVRLSPKNAAALYALVRDQGLPNTKVVIEGELPNAPLVASRTPPAAAARARQCDVDQMPWAATPRRGVELRQQQGQAVLRQPEAAPAPNADAGARVYVRPRSFGPFVYAPRAYAAQPDAAAAAPSARPRVYYDPRVVVIERSQVNGRWVERRYYRQAGPVDYQYRRWP